MSSIKFADVLQIINGKNQKQVECEDGKYPIYGSGGIMGWANDYICPAETVIIGRKGSINNPIFVDTPFWNVDTAFGLVADKNKLLPKYLYYFCCNFNFLSLNTTVTIPSLTKANLLKIEIQIPTLAEQNEIITILDNVERLIEIKRGEETEIESLIKSRFNELFGDPRLNDKGWREGTLSDFFTVKGGKRIPKGMGYSSEKTNHPYLRATDMKNETINEDDIHYIDEEVFQHIKRYTVNGGDIYLTNVGVNLGMAGVIPQKFDGASLTENAVKLVPKVDRVIDGLFLAHYINSPGIQEYINERKMTVGVPKLAIFRIETMPLLIPPLEIQQKFNLFVEQVEKAKQVIKEQLKQLEILKKSLMQKYFG